MSKTSEVKSRSIDIVGADANNLKNVAATFPLNRISIVTGVSGSGKSSLLSDTLAAEGSQRMRIFLGTSQTELERDDVRAFVGALPPTIFVGQRGFRPSVRTTVATATGFLSVLRRLFVLASAPYSERVKDNVPQPSPEIYARWISRHYRGLVEIWAAPVRQQRTDGIAAVKRFALHGIEKIIVRSQTDPPRLRDSGRVVDVSEFKGLNGNVAHTIEALVGTLEVSGTSQTKQLRELLDAAFSAGSGTVVITLPAAGDPDLLGPFGPRLDSRKHWVHPDVPEVFFRPSGHLLSFNAPEHEDSGACRACVGIGIMWRLNESALVSHPDRSMRDGAFAIWTETNYKYVNVRHETIEGLRGIYGFSPDVPWSALSASARALVLNGSGDVLVFDRDRTGRKFGAARRFAGFRKIILDRSAAGTKIAGQLAPYVEAGPCDVCGGTRWSFQARALRVGGHGIAEILGKTFAEVEALASLRGDFAGAIPSEFRFLLGAIRRHSHSIVSAGLSYLTGERGMLAVSEGESRRIRLARVLDAEERGLCLLLDEPARGLHESDLSKLAHSLERLRGVHTIILNEHREGLWDIADWFVEVGPGAGAAGGEIVFAGPSRRPGESRYKPLRTPLPVPADHPRITIRGASIHNVEDVDCQIPLGRLTCISGVSGSGKSSFVRGVLIPALLKSVGGTTPDFVLRQEGRWRSVDGTRSIDEVVALEQTMPPPNRRSLVATFTNIFDDIRNVFASSPAARREGLSAGDFGVNGGHGRCPICLGVGELQDNDLWSICPVCGGSRYGQSALSIRIDGINVQELLQTPVERLGTRSDTFSIPRGLIAAMCDLEIGYIAIGRRIDTLSGGELQRLRLAMRLGSVSAGSMFFILDEPAVGLHPRDVGPLAMALERVLDHGRNTIVMVEHDLRLIRYADWVLDFGPGSGPAGGKIVFAGLPEQLARSPTPTGLALAGKLVMRNRKATPPAATKRKLPLNEQVARATAVMRTLITGDAAATPEFGDGSAEPIVLVSERFWSGRDSWEVAGLDREIPKVLLDMQRNTDGDVFADLLATWKKDRDCWLAIHPFLTDMQVWGAELPQSVIRAVSAHVSREGLRLIAENGDNVGNGCDVRQLRATGARFIPEDDSDKARHRVLADSFAVGARYVELRDRKNRLRAIASARLLDLETAVIAPIVPVPSHFSRLDPLGRCPMCDGRRVVTAISERLVIGSNKVAPESEGFLTPEAQAVMKGVVRNELNPFLRRLTQEGLWDSKLSFERLDSSKRELITFGFWSRPSAGSFLKRPSSKASEVASWLRWDGMYRRVLEQVDRSRDAEWARRILDSAHPVRCLLCKGSGLRRFANLLRVGDMSFAKWALLSDADRMLRALRTVRPSTLRQRLAWQRILHCLAPLTKPGGAAVAAAIVERSVQSFTTMRAVEPWEVEESGRHVQTIS